MAPAHIMRSTIYLKVQEVRLLGNEHELYSYVDL